MEKLTKITNNLDKNRKMNNNGMYPEENEWKLEFTPEKN